MDAIGEVRKAIAAETDVKLAILYGSFASGAERPDSDFDLAVAGDAPFTADRLIRLSLSMGRASRREVQIRDLGRLNGLMLGEVLRKGRILKNDTALYAVFFARALDYAEDLLPTVRRIRAAQLDRFTHG